MKLHGLITDPGTLSDMLTMTVFRPSLHCLSLPPPTPSEHVETNGNRLLRVRDLPRICFVDRDVTKRESDVTQILHLHSFFSTVVSFILHSSHSTGVLFCTDASQYEGTLILPPFCLGRIV